MLVRWRGWHAHDFENSTKFSGGERGYLEIRSCELQNPNWSLSYHLGPPLAQQTAYIAIETRSAAKDALRQLMKKKALPFVYPDAQYSETKAERVMWTENITVTVLSGSAH